MMKKYKSLKDHVYDYIAEQIIEGELQPSERINETALSQKLQMSRTPVREALIQLSCEGVLDNIPRKGFILKGVTEKEASELYTVIGALDALCARTALHRLTEKDLEKMDFYIQAMDLAIKNNNYEMYLEQQDAFHQVYMDKCDNEVLSETITRLKNRFFTRGLFTADSGNGQDFLHMINLEHREILTLFQKQDKEALSHYIENVHWSPTHAHNEVLL